MIVGVITDLHFPQAEFETTSSTPAGLSVVATCAHKNIPVVICSDINHHHSNYLKDVVEVLSQLPSNLHRDIPFSEDSKDWDWAKKMLLKKIS